MTSRGGKKLESTIRQARAGAGVKEIEVGFYTTARYSDGTRVTNVAASNEFGDPDNNIPERPFMRRANDKAADVLSPIIRREIDPQKMTVERQLAERLGLAMQGIIQQEIVDLRHPPNARQTILRKGSSNPLVDTGFMRRSVTYRVTG